jgi:hypothetical protein
MSTHRITLSAFAFTVLITAAGATPPTGSENGKTNTPRGETFLFADCEPGDINQRVAALYKKSLVTATITDAISSETHHEAGMADDGRLGHRNRSFLISTAQQAPLPPNWADAWHPDNNGAQVWPTVSAGKRDMVPLTFAGGCSFGAMQASAHRCRLTQGTIHPFRNA